MKQKLHNIPLGTINALTIISGIITILTFIFSVINLFVRNVFPSAPVIAIIIVLMMCIIILFLRVRKYRDLASKRMSYTSKYYRLFTKVTRDTYFDIMHDYKLKKLDPTILSNKCISKLQSILDYLCYIMNSFTEKEVSACIKLIAYPNADEEVIDINNAELITFCRSTNSQDRGIKDKDTVIRLKDNTDFLEILDESNEKDYFYQGNLLEYAKSVHQLGRSYHNSNENWQEHYIGTTIVPIRIEFKLLYHQKKDDAYHIIGFLCVDSLDPDAFTPSQERYNVAVVRSFADAIYILLSQYRHYLAKFEKTGSSKEPVLLNK